MIRLLILALLFNCKLFAQDAVVSDFAFEEALVASGENKVEFDKVLRRFASDKEKLVAAKFLIAYSEYHYFRDQKSFENPNINKLVSIADKEYFHISKGKTNEQLKSEEFENMLLSIKNKIESEKSRMLFKSSVVDLTEANKTANAKYLIEQIEHAFWLKKNSVLVRDLEFQDFCEYILPYENTVGL